MIGERGIVLHAFPHRDRRLDDHLDLARLQRGLPRGRIVAQLHEDDFVEVRQRVAVLAHAPVTLALGQAAALARHVFLHVEGAGADRLEGDVAFEALGHDRGRVLEEVLGHVDRRVGAVQLDRVVVHLLDAGRRQVAHQAQQRGADVLVQPLAEVEHDVVRGELLAVTELDALLQVQGPGLQIVAGRPLLQHVRDSDALLVRVGQIVEDVAPGVRLADQRELGGMAGAIDLGAGGNDAAADRPGRLGGRRDRAAEPRWRPRPQRQLALQARARAPPQAARADALATDAPSSVAMRMKSRRDIWPWRSRS